MTVASARRTATRERLVQAAIGVIARNGVRGASVEEICEAAGFTRGAFYSNFDSKDELCVAILESRGRAYYDAAQEAIQGIDTGVDPAERIDRVAALFIRALGDDADSVLVMSELRLHAAREASVRDAFNACDRAMVPAFVQLVEDALRANRLRLTVPVGQALGLLHAVFDQTALDQLVQGGNVDPGHAATSLARVLQAFVVDA